MIIDGLELSEIILGLYIKNSPMKESNHRKKYDPEANASFINQFQKRPEESMLTPSKCI